MSDYSKKMYELARQVREHAYVPYSKFKVGACLRNEKNELFAGCNVENAAFPDGMCAEACAMAALVSSGARKICEILVVADSKDICSPCGGCRQKLREFAGPDVLVHLCDLNGIRKTMTMQELLPLSFSSGVMEK